MYVILGLCKASKAAPLCPPLSRAHACGSGTTVLNHNWKREGAPRGDCWSPCLTREALGHQESHLVLLTTHSQSELSPLVPTTSSNLPRRNHQCPAVWGKAASTPLLGHDCALGVQTSGSPLRSDQRVSDGDGIGPLLSPQGPQQEARRQALLLDTRHELHGAWVALHCLPCPLVTNTFISLLLSHVH